MPVPRLTDSEIRTLRAMMDEFDFARNRKLLATQRWRSSRVWTLYVLGAALYVAQLTVALYAITHH